MIRTWNRLETVAKNLGTTPNILRWMLERGEVSYVRSGDRLMLDEAEVRRVLAAKSAESQEVGDEADR